MNHRQRITILALLATPFRPYAAEDLNQTFQQATKLIQPYLILTDQSSTDPRSKEGKEELANAIAMLGRVTKDNPNHWPSYWFIGKAYQALREHPASYQAFKQSLTLKPPNLNVAREFIIEAICVGATGEAVVAARQVAEANPSDSGLLANLGLALIADGQVSQARAATERALGMAPSDEVTRSLLAEITQVQAGRPPSKYCPP